MIFGVYPDDTVWLQPQSFPDTPGALYRHSLKSVVDDGRLHGLCVTPEESYTGCVHFE